MICLNCGREIHPGERFCPGCGAPVAAGRDQRRTDMGENHTNSGHGKNSRRAREEKKEKIILGILSVLIILLTIAIVGGIIWIVTSKSTSSNQVNRITRDVVVKDTQIDDEEKEPKTRITPETTPVPTQVPVTEEPVQEQPATPVPTQVPVTEAPEQPPVTEAPVTPAPTQAPVVETTPVPPAPTVEAPSEPLYTAGGDYIIADSNTRYLTNSDLNALSEVQLRLVRNEIYARHGRIFKSQDLIDYFSSKSWYVPTVDGDHFDNSCLNVIEVENLKLILNYEKAHNLNQ